VARRPDPFALVAALLACAMLVVYLVVIRQQDGHPAGWAVAVLILGAVAAAYGALVRVPYRRVSLAVAGLLLLSIGVLAILTIGLPILVAGGLCVIALARATPATAP
jgi:hypothetical protein